MEKSNCFGSIEGKREGAKLASRSSTYSWGI